MELDAEAVRTSSSDDTSICVGSSSILDREPVCVEAGDGAARVLDRLLEKGSWGAAVLDDHGRYLGACTLRRIADLALLVSAESSRFIQSFAYHREGADGLAARLGSKTDIPAAQLLDPTVPVLRGSQSLPQALVLLVRQAPMAAVLDDLDGRLLGVVTLESALQALHARSGLAAHQPA